VKAWEHTTGREAAAYRRGAVACCSEVRLPCTWEQTLIAGTDKRRLRFCQENSLCLLVAWEKLSILPSS